MGKNEIPSFSGNALTAFESHAFFAWSLGTGPSMSKSDLVVKHAAQPYGIDRT